MAIYGDVSCLGLEDVFRFLAGNAHEGVLAVKGGNNASGHGTSADLGVRP